MRAVEVVTGKPKRFPDDEQEGENVLPDRWWRTSRPLTFTNRCGRKLCHCCDVHPSYHHYSVYHQYHSSDIPGRLCIAVSVRLDSATH